MARRIAAERVIPQSIGEFGRDLLRLKRSRICRHMPLPPHIYQSTEIAREKCAIGAQKMQKIAEDRPK
jgi:hypothetical protein